MTKNKAIASDPERPRPSVSFYFTKGEKPGPPKNFSDMKIGQEVVVSVTGKVRSLRVDEDTSSFDVFMEEVKVAAPKTKVKGMADTMTEIQEARKT
mgnify:CR=1 FL=1